MATNFRSIAFGPAVLAAQQAAYGRTEAPPPIGEPDLLGEDEKRFLESRDSFYLASVNADGWPYVQHRGGAPGFLRVLDAERFAFPDYRGNRQLISVGNTSENARVALILMDYPSRTRLKILGEARTLTGAAAEPLLALWPEQKSIERVFEVRVHGFDWNCPKYITPRFTEAEVEDYVAPLRTRVQELERELARLRKEKSES
ncbi:MAG: pyridoxamine 5'-phosphate oxidase family protein [Planctomycetes bacterium]|nr:pyridoxamine 5'-phosphate oxidase family protein [Planctomycetota bacterium]